MDVMFQVVYRYLNLTWYYHVHVVVFTINPEVFVAENVSYLSESMKLNPRNIFNTGSK